MVDFTFDIEIHVGGCFVEEPTIEYVGGSIHLLTEIDPDKLSFFEIRDLCHLVGAPKEHSRYRYSLPEGNLQVDLRDIEIDADVLNMTTLHRAWPENDEEENVEDVEISVRDEEQNVEGEDNDDDDDDWLNGGLEGDDFGDDIFAAQNLTPQGSAPNTAPESNNAPYTAPKSSNAPHTSLESSNAPHTTPKSSNAFHADLKWAEPALEDDLVTWIGLMMSR